MVSRRNPRSSPTCSSSTPSPCRGPLPRVGREGDSGSSFFCVHDPELRILASALGGGQHPTAQKVEPGAPVHGALDDLQTVDLALDRAGAPGHRRGGMHGITIVTEAR